MQTFLLIRADSLVTSYRRITQALDGKEPRVSSVVLVQCSEGIIA